MSKIFARANFGGLDLYHGVPDVENAVVVKVNREESDDDYITILTLRNEKGQECEIHIRQERR